MILFGILFWRDLDQTLYKYYNDRLLEPANWGTITMHSVAGILLFIGLWLGLPLYDLKYFFLGPQNPVRKNNVIYLRELTSILLIGLKMKNKFCKQDKKQTSISVIRAITRINDHINRQAPCLCMGWKIDHTFIYYLMNKPLSPKLKRFLDCIQRFTLSHGQSPSYEEIWSV
ncbi:hypothetical protein Ct9H90mP29_03090 [bacterium]|nr:MAG: hypothetical protein Ct9H90mP29_03090 [bacterium]